MVTYVFRCCVLQKWGKIRSFKIPWVSDVCTKAVCRKQAHVSVIKGSLNSIQPGTYSDRSFPLEITICLSVDSELGKLSFKLVSNFCPFGSELTRLSHGLLRSLSLVSCDGGKKLKDLYCLSVRQIVKFLDIPYLKTLETQKQNAYISCQVKEIRHLLFSTNSHAGFSFLNFGQLSVRNKGSDVILFIQLTFLKSIYFPINSLRHTIYVKRTNTATCFGIQVPYLWSYYSKRCTSQPANLCFVEIYKFNQNITC